jgi:transposase-like protein
MENTIAKDKSAAVSALPLACADEKTAVEFLESARWNGKALCPHCKSDGVYQMKDRKTGERNRRFLWRCRPCGKQFTVRVGTVYEDSLIPLRHWCYAFWAACSSKKGVSALQVKRQTGLSYKSALFMMHRVRAAMRGTGIKTVLSGTVEADETYVGGKPRNPGKHNKRGRGTKKTPVFAVVERNGNVRTSVVQRLDGESLTAAIKAVTDPSARIITDENPAYNKLANHETVNHGRREFARGDVHSNTVEGFFSLIKRGLYGVYHAVSKKHLPRYINEFEFRYDTRGMDDGERTMTAMHRAAGVRLMYQEQTA